MVIDETDWGGPRERIGDAIDEHAPGILPVAPRIHDRPELGFAEHFAAGLLADELGGMGYAVERGLGGLPTAFRATRRVRAAGPTVDVLAEYDAPPNLGHGRGHNSIAASALAVAIGLTPVLDQLSGTLTIVGTSAEESGGGKIYL